MQRLSNISELDSVWKGCVLTIGNFDGVHLGHQEILVAAKQAAAERQVPLVVMTFEPHPLAVLRPDTAPGALTPPALKEHLVGRFGADYFFVVQSNPELLKLSAEEFIRRFLVDNIRPGLVVEGESFNFGSGRTGGIETLVEASRKNGFEVAIVPPKEVSLTGGRAAVAVSSTLIRELLAEGSVASAAAALGRAYRLIEKVVAGRGKGKRLGFPTANMKLPAQVVPAEGVYAGFAATADSAEEILLADAKVPAALSIGRTATYGEGQSLLIEAHLLTDNVPDLYDKYLAMDFVARTRGQRKFTTASDLSAQIAKDCEQVVRILKS